MLEIIRPGIFDTIQDLGRFGFRSLGVSVSGAMHQRAFSEANALLENEFNDAALEMSQVGGVYRFHAPSFFTLSGARKDAYLNGVFVEPKAVHQAKEGDELVVAHSKEAVYTYLAVKGGFQTEMRLGSRSMHPSLFEQPRLQKGQQLAYTPQVDFIRSPAVKASPALQEDPIMLKAHKGPEFYFLSDLIRVEDLDFKVAEFNRMGYRLLPSVHLKKKEEAIRSCAVFPGIVQLTPSGEWIVLHRDAQVSGGYPRILMLSDESLDRLAQCPRDRQLKLQLL